MRGVVLLLCAVGGGLAGGMLVPLIRGEALTPAPREVRGPGTDPALVRELADRLALLEQRAREGWSESAGAEAPSPMATPVPGNRPSASAAASEKSRAAAAPKAIAPEVEKLVKGLIGRKFGNNEANRLFGWMIRNKGKIPDMIRALLKQVESDPQNADLRVALATAYVGELTNNTSQGPQQGMVWAKASAAYDAAIKINPEHWQARYGKAFGVSMAPEFLGLKPVAIKQFEQLRAIQERGAPAPEHVQTYFRLGTLYKNMGNAEKAREVWEHGMKLFPDNALLKNALEASTKR